MIDIKNQVQGMNPNIQARNITEVAAKTGNVYESLNIIAKRANQLSVDIKQELQAKLDEFAVSSDTIEEVQENKEQIEISKFYERLPNAVIISINEFLDDQIHYHYKNKELNPPE